MIIMAKKHIPTDGHGNATEVYKPKKKPPKPYKEPQWLRDYRLNRNRNMWKQFPESRTEIEEMTAEMKRNWSVQDKRV